MPQCRFCNQDNLEWYQDFQEKWRLGIKLDINNYRKHVCKTEKTEPSNKRNWSSFTCEKCGNITKQNLKLVKTTTLNYCLECDNQ